MHKIFGNAKEIALERIAELFEEAGSRFRKNRQMSRRYVELALKIAAKSGIRVPREQRSKYCKKCKNYLLSGVNAKIRTREGKVIISCLHCGSHRRILIKPRT